MAAMADDAALSPSPSPTLCGTCKSQPFKYRCPACGARTCSLPCYNRHKQWTQCSGKRDPARYIKKSDLATPAGIDHDYNFLSSIERGLEAAARHARAAPLPHILEGPPASQQKGAVSRARLEQAAVTVLRAPWGITRQQQNKTHLSGKRNIVWTVEWIHPDQTSTLSQCSETQTLSIGYDHVLSQARPNPPAKRKRDQEEQPALVHQSEAPAVAHDAPSTDRESQHQQPSASTDTASPPSGVASHPSGAPESHPPSPRFTFYLLRIRTATPRHVLIPLDGHARLGECLRNCTVAEFPTVYVFPASLESLPAEFLLSDDYDKQRRGAGSEAIKAST